MTKSANDNVMTRSD